MDNNKELRGKLYVGSAPRRLLAGTLKARKKLIAENRRARFAEIRETRFKYYCAICLIIRDENEYLQGWLEWHIASGVEHFYIYDHDSKQSVRAFVSGLGDAVANKVTVIEWNGMHKDAQPEAYNDCLRRFARESRWIGFIDADEQVRVKTGSSLPAFLKGYEKFAGVFAVWITYDANGRVRRSNEPLRTRFTRVNTSDPWMIKAGKVFVQPLLMREMVIHNGMPEVGFDVVDEHKRKIPPYRLTCENPTRDCICVDHYYTKSYEEWVNKIKRGCGHAKYLRKYEEFFDLNHDLEFCRENTVEKQKYEHSDK